MTGMVAFTERRKGPNLPHPSILSFRPEAEDLFLSPLFCDKSLIQDVTYLSHR